MLQQIKSDIFQYLKQLYTLEKVVRLDIKMLEKEVISSLEKKMEEQFRDTIKKMK